MMDENYSERDLEGMTPDEIKYLSELDNETDKTETEKEDTAPNDIEPVDDGKNAEEQKIETEPAEPVEETVSANPDIEPIEENRLADRDFQHPQQIIKDTQDQLKKIDDELNELANKFDNGDLTALEYTQQQMQLADQRTELLIDQKMSQRTAEEQLDNWVYETVPTFIKSHEQYANTDSIQYQLLDAEVKRLQEQAIARGENSLTKAILEQAHNNLINAAKQLTGQINNNMPRLQNREMPPTLSHTPTAEISDMTDGGQTGYLDRLAETDTIAFEKEFEKLTPEQQERYLSR